jgi:hypothetical protein
MTGATVTVVASTGNSPDLAVSVAATAPAIYTQDGSGTGDGTFTRNNQVVNLANPAYPANVITAAVNGLGITIPATPDGQAVSSPSPTVTTPTVMVGTVAATVSSSAIGAGNPGFYNVTFTVPAGLTGPQPVVITSNGVSSPAVTLQLGGSSPSPTIAFGSNLGTVSYGPIQWALSATGGNGNYAWSVTSGNLPPGISLRTDVPSWFPNNASAGLIGVATTPGTYNFTLSLTSNGTTVTQACTWTITGLSIIDPWQLPDAFQDNSYSYPFVGIGSGPYLWTATGLPTGLTISPSGMVSGTPTVSGQFNPQVTISNGTDTVSRGFSLYVSAVKPSWSQRQPNALQNQTYSTTVAATGGTGPYTFSICCWISNGITLNGSTGFLGGTMNTGPGPWDFSLTASDSANHSYSQNTEVYVTGVPKALPGLNAGTSDDCSVGNCDQAFSLANGGTAPFTWQVSGPPPANSLPTGMQWRAYPSPRPSWINPSQVEVYGAPTTPGTYSVTITATDADNAAVTQIFPLRVSPMTVLGEDYLPNGTLGVGYSKTLRVIGGVPPYTVSVVSGKLPAGLVLNGMTVSGTPLENGNANVTFLFVDHNSNQLRQSMGFNITPSILTITTNYDLGISRASSQVSWQLITCCNPGVNWSVAAGSALPNGLTLSASGMLTGTPTIAGSYTFRLQATDSFSSYAAKEFVLVVTGLNITTSSLPYGNLTSSYNQTIAYTGATGTVSFALMTGNYLPPGLTMSSGGTISGTPTQTGQFGFTVIATDGGNNTYATRYYSISIYAAGGAPPVTVTGGLPSIMQIGQQQMALFASGGNGTYTWSLVGGTLPPGMSLRPDGAAWFPSNASGCFCGVATQPGTYTFTLRATSATQTGDMTYTVKVTALRLKDNYSLEDAFLTVAYRHQLQFLGAAGPVTVTATGVPPGLTVSSTGLISGTPTTAGYYNIGITLSDGVDTVNSTVNPSVSVYAIHFTNPAPLPPATQYQAYSTTVAAAGGSGTYTFTASNLPSGLTINQGTGGTTATITGTPTVYGRWYISLTATDSNHVSYVQYTSLVIIGSPNQPFSLNAPSADHCTIGVPCTRSIGAVNGGTAPFTWSVSGLPDGMDFRTGYGTATYSVWAGDLELWGSPSAAGTTSYRVTATDATGQTSTQTYSLVVSPLFVDGSSDNLPNGTRGVAYSKKLRVLGGTPPYTLAKVDGLLPNGVSLSGFTVSGVPAENGGFNPVMVWTDNAGQTLRRTYGFSIGGGTSTISINDYYNLGQIVVNSSYSHNFSACCVPPYTWSVEPGSSLPPGLGLSAPGMLSGIPTAIGNYTFSIRAANAIDSTNYGVRQFVLAVTNLNITTPSTLPYTNVGAGFSQTLAATGGTGALTWSLAANQFLPQGITLSPGGVIGGSPAYTGFFIVTINVTDSSSPPQTCSRTFFISVFPAGGYPPLTHNMGPTMGPNSTGLWAFQIAASGGAPPYHFSYTPAATPIPGMRVQDGGQMPTNFPSNVTAALIGVITTQGVYTTSIRVTDSTGTSYDRPLTWSVYDDAPVGTGYTLPRAAVGTAYAVTFPGYGGSGNYSFSASNLPAGLSISTGGVLSGSPTASGSFSPTITIKDLTSNISLGYGYSLVVDPFPITTGGSLPQGMIGVAYSQTLSAPGCGTGCSWSVASGSVPSGLTLSSAGALSGTPNGYYNSSFTAQASGSNGTAQKILSLRINFNTPQPLYIGTGTTIGPSGQASVWSSSLAAQGGVPPYSWSLASGSLPDGMTLVSPGETYGYLNPGWTYLVGRPVKTGNFNFTLKVTDAASNSTTKAFTFVVPTVWINITSFPISGNPLRYGSAWSQQMLAQGGTGIYTWSIASGFLPPGLSLNGTTGVISGTPQGSGSYSIGLTATDSNNVSVTQNVSFTVNTATGVNLNPGLTGNIYVIGLGNTNVNNGFSPSGGTPPYTVQAVTPYPPGCSIEFGASVLANAGATFVLACTPLAAGDYPFTYRVDDSAGNTAYRTVTVHVAPFYLFSSTTLQSGSVGVPYSAPMMMFGNTAGMSVAPAAGSALPPGLSIAGTSITGTPTQAGNYGFTIGFTDASGYVLNYGFSLSVSDLAITTPDIIPVQAIYSTPYTYTMTATGGGARTWSATGLPSGLSMSTAGVISGTPTGTGTYRLMVTVTSGTATLTKAITLFSRFATADVPNTTVILVDGRVGGSYSQSLGTTGGVPPYTWTLASGSSLPAGLSLLSGTSLSSYASTMTAGITYLLGVPTTVGSYSFDLIATDSVGTQMRKPFTLNVTAITIIGGSLRNGTVGQAYGQQLTASGGTAPYTFTFETIFGSDFLPAGLSAAPTGLISGTPTMTGSYAFSAVAHDAAGHTYRAQYSITVSNANGLLVNSSTPVWSAAGQPLTGQLSAAVISGPLSTYNWSVVSGALPPGVALFPSGNNTFVGGAPSIAGTYNFVLRATDKANTSNTADRAYSIYIPPMQLVTHRLPQMPPARLGTSYTYTFQLTGGTPPYTYSNLTGAPAGLVLSPGGVLSGVPTEVGSFSYIQFNATDSTGASGLYSPYTLNVLPAGLPNPVRGRVFSFEAASAGQPYVVMLDEAAIGGTAPLTWTVTTGFSLPPGISIVPAANGVSAYLAGIAPAAGTYTFSLDVRDAAGQTGTAQCTLVVSPLMVTPAVVPSAMVGTVFSTMFSASGGTGPYTYSMPYWAALPPGLSLSSSGVLSGTATTPGYYPLAVTVNDNAGNSITALRYLTIDNAAGQAPGVWLSPAPINLNYTVTAPAPAPTPVNVNTTSATLPFKVMTGGIQGLTLSASSGTGTTPLSLSLNTGSLTAGTYSGVVAVNAAQSGNMWVAVPVTLTVVNPPPCNYSITPPSGSVASSGGSGSFSVSAGSLCAWTATTDSPASVTINSGSGPGAGTVSYTVTANPGTDPRVAHITVGGQTHTITQFGSTCSFSINPGSLSVTAAGGIATVNVTSSLAGCPWSVTNPNGLTASPTSGTGSGSVSVTIPANTGTNTIYPGITIAGQPFSVTQAGVDCTVSLGSGSASFGPAGGSGSVNITSNCGYSSIAGPSWIPITSGATGTAGTGSLTFSVQPNSSTTSRSGTLTIGGHPFFVSQDPTPCSVTLDASGLPGRFDVGPGSGILNVTANGSNCAWTASSPAPWVTITPASGNGSASLQVTAGSNAAAPSTLRNSTITVGGQSIGVVQSGTACIYTLGASTVNVPYGGGSGSVTMTAPGVCTWSSAVTSGNSWLSITSSGTGGTADVVFTAAPNTASAPRSGSITVQGQTVAVTQAAAPCSYVLVPNSTTVAAGGGSSSFTYSTSTTGCTTQALSYNGWLGVTTVPGTDTSGQVNFTADPNPAGTMRGGTIQFGNQTFTVNQTAAACSYSLNAYGIAVGPGQFDSSLLGSQSAVGCTPTVGTDQPLFISVPTSGFSGPVANVFTQLYTVQPFTPLTPGIRRGNIIFGGRIFSIKQTSW